MKFRTSDLMEEGWSSMEAILQEEMPVQKNRNPIYILMAFCTLFAFVGGYLLGYSNDDIQVVQLPQEATMASNNINSNLLSSEIDFQSTNLFNSAIALNISSNIIAPSSKLDHAMKSKMDQSNLFNFSFDHLVQGIELKSLMQFSPRLTTQKESPKVIAPLELEVTSNELDEIPVLIGNDNKVKKPAKWNVGLGAYLGTNPSRNTEIAALRAEWIYSLGKGNGVGFEFMYSAEKEILRFSRNYEETPSTIMFDANQNKTANVINIINPSRFRYAVGIVGRQEIGSKLYLNLSAGLDIAKNVGEIQTQFKSEPNDLNQVVQYNWGSYASVSLGYNLTKSIKFEINGSLGAHLNKSNLLRSVSTNKLLGGVKYSF